MPAARRSTTAAVAARRRPLPPLPVADPADPANLAMAHKIARGVRIDYHFGEGSQEEFDLEAVALLVVCEYAARFDPLASFRAGAEKAMGAAVLAYRPGDTWGCSGGVFVQALTVFGRDMTEWVEEAAGRLAAQRDGFRDVCAEVAVQAAAGYAAQFDAGRAFRGWCSIEVRSRCKREALRLRNGGTFNTKRPGAMPSVSPLPRARCANCSDVTGVAPEVWSEALPRREAQTGELEANATRQRIDRRLPLVASAADSRASADVRPALDGEDPDEPWSPFDTTPDE